jgi:sRNA-binding protein
MNYRPPPKAPNAGAILGMVVLVLIGVPFLLCMVGGLVIWGMAGFPKGNARWGLAGSGWQECVAQHKRFEQELLADIKATVERNNNSLPPNEAQRIIASGFEMDRQMREKIQQTQRDYGPPSASVLKELSGTPEIDAYLASVQFNRSQIFPGSGSGTDPNGTLAQMRAEQEQRMAQMRAEQTQRDAERLARSQELAAQREAERQAEEQRRRDRLASLPQFTPQQPFVPPPAFNPPAQPAQQQPQANEPPPGFPATDLAQIKLKDSVFVQVGGQWFPAFVQLKRGKLVQVRSTTSGNVEVVTLERIRLANEPTARPESSQPRALQIAQGSKTAPGNDKEQDDDALFIAKPKSDESDVAGSTESPSPTPGNPATTAKPAASVARYRTWTNETGEFKIEAELVSFEFDLVTLRRRDGKLSSLRIEKLSAADQAFVRESVK